MRGFGELLIGLVLVIAGVGMLVNPWGVIFFRDALIIVILGVIPIIVLLAGAVFLMIGVSDVREKGEEIEIESEKEEGGSSGND